MKRKLYGAALSAALVLIAAVTAQAQHEHHGGQIQTMQDKQTSQKTNDSNAVGRQATQAVYTCPMHPEVKSDKSGKCPKCGMALVAKQAGGQANAPQSAPMPAQAEKKVDHSHQNVPAQGEKMNHPTTQHQHGDTAIDVSGNMSKMTSEAHLVIAMAYHESVVAFAKALRQHIEQAGAVNGDFARSMVAEIRRGIDQMGRYHQEHLDALTPEMRGQLSAMVKQMEPHHAQMKEQLEALERETGGDQIDRRRVAQHTAELIKHLEQMSGAHGGHAGHSK
jgi:hypothetical protein